MTSKNELTVTATELARRTGELLRLAEHGTTITVVDAKHPDWVLGFADEVWWSRLQRPRMRAWTEGAPLTVSGPDATSAALFTPEAIKVLARWAAVASDATERLRARRLHAYFVSEWLASEWPFGTVEYAPRT